MEREILFRGAAAAAGLTCALGLAGCGGGGADRADQSHLCVFSYAAGAKKSCHTGDVALYTPSTFGNEHLPLLMMAGYCDTNAPIQYNNGGFVCRFDDERAAQLTKAFGS
jgi:hypothetical protein